MHRDINLFRVNIQSNTTWPNWVPPVRQHSAIPSTTSKVLLHRVHPSLRHHICIHQWWNHRRRSSVWKKLRFAYQSISSTTIWIDTAKTASRTTKSTATVEIIGRARQSSIGRQWSSTCFGCVIMVVSLRLFIDSTLGLLRRNEWKCCDIDNKVMLMKDDTVERYI